MSEKRFTIEESENQLIIFDNGVSDETYFHLGNDERDVKYVCDLLNEQSERIKSLEMELDLIANTKLFSRRKLEEENEQMKKQLEQIPKSIREVWLE